MKHKVAVEPNLTPVNDLLVEKGYQVDSLNFNEEADGQAEGYDAFIVTGMNKNFLGMHDTESKAVVIDATGMSPEQVYHELQTKLD
jgi:hypothetical protein